MTGIVVSAMYHFARLDNYQDMQGPLRAFLKANEIKGTVLLASEGINGTLAGSAEAIARLHIYLRADPRLAGLVTKESYHHSLPFHRTRVKLKREIVTMGVEDIDPGQRVGTYVKPAQWNALISDPDVVLVDTRNDYEVGIGTFKGAINPKTDRFRAFPDYVAKELSGAKDKKIAMFCTGGIRCEKSTAYLKQQGFKDVFHLEGGILNYLAAIPRDESLWEGECFVFDSRVAVNHDLEKGSYDQCFACRMPVREEDKTHPDYEKGVSCHHCRGKKSESQIKRYTDRETQMRLSEKTGDIHIGGSVSEVIARRREMKRREKQL